MIKMQMSLGQPTYLKGKPRGDHSMLVKRKLDKGVYARVSQDLSGMVKPDWLNLSNHDVNPTYPLPHLKLGCLAGLTLSRSEGKTASRQSQAHFRWAQGYERGTYSRSSYVSSCWNTGLPTGRETYGNGVPIVVRDGESPLHGEGEQMKSYTENWRYARCETPKK